MKKIQILAVLLVIFSFLSLTKETKAQSEPTCGALVNISLVNVPASNVKSWDGVVILKLIDSGEELKLKMKIPSGTTYEFTTELPICSYTGVIEVYVRLYNGGWLNWIGKGKAEGSWNCYTDTVPIVVENWDPIGE